MTDKNFKELGLGGPILKAIKEQHFSEPTSIQEKSIPLVLEGQDVIGVSKTGSGKTLAFGCKIIQDSKIGNGIQALILVPTRELAEQVAKSFRTFSKHKKLRIIKIYGGVSINPQMQKLRSADVVIGTPGRILDHINRKTINLKKVKTMVLDEADMMLDMGFLPDVEKIISFVPKERQTLLFSATMSRDIKHLTEKHMEKPKRIEVEEYVDSTQLKQVFYDISGKQKLSLLINLLKNEKKGLVMVFCNTRRTADFVGDNLKANKIRNCVIHGGLTQNKRNSIMQDFHSGKVYTLVCTDVAARGLDIKGVTHVYNYDTCKDPKQYIHRIGRTARAGKNGKAITLLAQRDYINFSKVQDANNLDVEKLEVPELEKVKIVTASESSRSSYSKSVRPRRSSRGYSDKGSRRSRGTYSEDRPKRSRSDRSSRDDYSDDSPRRSRESYSNDNSRGSRSSRPKRREGSSRPRSSRPQRSRKPRRGFGS